MRTEGVAHFAFRRLMQQRPRHDASGTWIRAAPNARSLTGRPSAARWPRVFSSPSAGAGQGAGTAIAHGGPGSAPRAYTIPARTHEKTKSVFAGIVTRWYSSAEQHNFVVIFAVDSPIDAPGPRSRPSNGSGTSAIKGWPCRFHWRATANLRFCLEPDLRQHQGWVASAVENRHSRPDTPGKGICAGSNPERD